MLTLSQNLKLDHCPHCSIANPNLFIQTWVETEDHKKQNQRSWGIYYCGGCGGVVIASGKNRAAPVMEYFPFTEAIQEDIPLKPREYLRQARSTFHAPAGSIMLCASAVDAMLKAKGLIEGNLYSRIEKAAAQHIITDEMSKWAHEVRLDANDQRHADDNADLPTEADAKRAFDFAISLAEIMFVLPARVQRGLSTTSAE